MNFLKQTKKDNCLVTCACMVMGLSDPPDIKTQPELFNFAYEKGYLVHMAMINYETELIGSTQLDDFVLRKLMIQYPGVVLLKRNHCYAHENQLFVDPATGQTTSLYMEEIDGYLAFHRIKSTKRS